MNMNFDKVNKQKIHDSLVLCLVMDSLKADGQDGWITGGSIGVVFYKRMSNLETGGKLDETNRKVRFRDARNNAIALGWIERGQRTSTKKGNANKSKIVTVQGSHAAVEKDNAKKTAFEDYLRLRKDGKALVVRQNELNVSSRDVHVSSPRIVYVKNIPGCATIGDLVEYFDSTYGCIIIAAKNISDDAKKKKHNDNDDGYWLAYAKTKSSLDAETLVVLSDQSQLVLHGRQLKVLFHKCQDLQLPPIEEKMKSKEALVLSDINTSTMTTTTTIGDKSLKEEQSAGHHPTLESVEADAQSPPVCEKLNSSHQDFNDNSQADDSSSNDDVPSASESFGMEVSPNLRKQAKQMNKKTKKDEEATHTQTPPSDEKLHAKSHRLKIKNVPNEISILRLVRYLENEVNCTILRAEKEVVPHWCTGREYCSVVVEVEKGNDARSLVSMSKKLQLHFRLLEITRDTSPETERDGEAGPLHGTCYQRGPTSTPLDLHLTDHSKLLCICLLRASTEPLEWQNIANVDQVFKDKLMKRKPNEVKKLSTSFVKNAFRKSVTEAWENNLVEFGRHRILEKKHKSPAISVVPEGPINDGSWYALPMYLRLTEDGITFATEFTATFTEVDVDEKKHNDETTAPAIIISPPRAKITSPPIKKIVSPPRQNPVCPPSTVFGKDSTARNNIINGGIDKPVSNQGGVDNSKRGNRPTTGSRQPISNDNFKRETRRILQENKPKEDEPSAFSFVMQTVVPAAMVAMITLWGKNKGA